MIITAVNKQTTNLKVKFFGNHPDIDEEYDKSKLIYIFYFIIV